MASNFPSNYIYAPYVPLFTTPPLASGKICELKLHDLVDGHRHLELVPIYSWYKDPVPLERFCSCGVKITDIHTDECMHTHMHSSSDGVVLSEWLISSRVSLGKFKTAEWIDHFGLRSASGSDYNLYLQMANNLKTILAIKQEDVLAATMIIEHLAGVGINVAAF